MAIVKAKRTKKQIASAKKLAMFDELSQAIERVYRELASFIKSEYEGTSTLDTLMRDLAPIRKVILKARAAKLGK